MEKVRRCERQEDRNFKCLEVEVRHDDMIMIG